MYWVVWCSGVLLAKSYVNNTLKIPSKLVLITALLIFGIAIAAQMRGIPPPYLAIPYGYFYLVLLWYGITTEHSWNPRLPAFLVKILTVLGTCSFSLYLIHKPIFRVCGVLWAQTFGGKPVSFLIPLIFSVMIVFVGWGFYLLVEAPTHKWAKKLSRKVNSPATIEK